MNLAREEKMCIENLQYQSRQQMVLVANTYMTKVEDILGVGRVVKSQFDRVCSRSSPIDRRGKELGFVNIQAKVVRALNPEEFIVTKVARGGALVRVGAITASLRDYRFELVLICVCAVGKVRKAKRVIPVAAILLDELV